jgi:hypothetical protein
MVPYPLTIPRVVYHGTILKRLQQTQESHETATILENHINTRFRQNNDSRFLYSSLARELSLKVALVKALLMRAGGSGNAITIIDPKKPD